MHQLLVSEGSPCQLDRWEDDGKTLQGSLADIHTTVDYTGKMLCPSLKLR